MSSRPVSDHADLFFSTALVCEKLLTTILAMIMTVGEEEAAVEAAVVVGIWYKNLKPQY